MYRLFRFALTYGGVAVVVFLVGRYALFSFRIVPGGVSYVPASNGEFSPSEQKKKTIAEHFGFSKVISDPRRMTGVSGVGSSAGLGTFGLSQPSAAESVSDQTYNSLSQQLYRSPSAPITDTREFLKTNYAATLKTRDVPALGSRLTTIIRGYGGRVDTFSLQERSGYVSFALPKRSYESFAREIKTLVPARFFLETVGEYNRLPEKQIIEQNQRTTEETLATLHTNRQTLIDGHDRTVQSFNWQLSIVRKNITALDAELADHPERVDDIAKRKAVFLEESRRLGVRLRQEHQTFATQLANMDARIREQQSYLSSIFKRDQLLQDDVETVQGAITLQWVSLPMVAKIYLGDYWFWLLLLVPVFYVFRKRPPVLDVS